MKRNSLIAALLLGTATPAFAAGTPNVTGSNNTATGTGYYGAQIYGNNNTDTGYDSVIYGTANNTANSDNTAIGQGNISNGMQGSAIGNGNTSSGQYANAIGTSNTVDSTSNQSSAVGNNNSVTTSVGSLATGTDNRIVGVGTSGGGENGPGSSGAGNTAVGDNNYVSGTNNSAIGTSNTVDNSANTSGVNNGSAALGAGNNISGINSYAIGNNNVVSGGSSVAIGNGAYASGDSSFVIGNNSMAATTAANSVVLGNESYTSRSDVVSVGSDYTGHESQRQIVNVAAGTQGTDAVNVNQLNSALTASEQYADNLFNSINTGGGGSGGTTTGTDANAIHYDDSSKKTATLEGQGGTQVKNVANGTAPTDAANVGQVQAGDAATLKSAEQYTNNTAVTYDSSDGKNITLKAESGAQIHNLAAGTANTDAANVGQVKQMNAQTLKSANNYTDTRIDGLSQKIQKAKRQSNAGIASALAVASIPQASPGKSMIAGGVSEYNGQEGFAVGYSHHWQFDNGTGVVMKAAATANTQGDGGFAVGAGYEW
jgi:autotransporter adhesin